MGSRNKHFHRQWAQRQYKTRRWRAIRQRQLLAQPMCECPEHEGKTIRADDPRYGGAIVDHIQPHRGDSRLFYNTSNLQSLTKRCHDSYKQRYEKREYTGVDEKGRPLVRRKQSTWFEKWCEQ